MKEPPTSKASQVLHPVRARILGLHVGGRHLTTNQIRERLPDVAQASVYRHIRILHEAGLLTVVSEKPIRGGVERTYALTPGEALVSADEFRDLPDERRSAELAAFITRIWAEAETALADREGSAVSFTLSGFDATEAELREMLAHMQARIAQLAAVTPTEPRTRWTLATVLTGESPAG
ncbi:helix-turn-helix domain-containing protein [Okibacterium endophyticum]